MHWTQSLVPAYIKEEERITLGSEYHKVGIIKIHLRSVTTTELFLYFLLIHGMRETSFGMMEQRRGKLEQTLSLCGKLKWGNKEKEKKKKCLKYRIIGIITTT